MNINNPLEILVIHTSQSQDKTLISRLYEGNRRHKIKVVHSIHEASLMIQKEKVQVIILHLASNLNQPYKYIQRCLTEFETVPIVIVDDGDNEIIGTQAIRAGVQDYIPYHQATVKNLNRTVQYTLERHQQISLLERKQGDLINNLNRLQVHQELSQVGTWEFQSIKQEIVGDRRFFQQLGIKNTDRISKDLYMSLVHPEDTGAVRDFFNRVSQIPEPQVCDHRIILNNVTRFISLSASFKILPAREEGVILGTSIMLDKSLTFNHTLKQSQFQRRMLEIRDKLLNQTAFNIRTPLFSITNFLFLLKDHPLQKKHKQSFEGIQESLDELQHHLNRLMNVTLATNIQTELKESTFELKRELELNLQLSEGVGGDDVASVHLRLAANLPFYAVGDPVHLFQVLMIMKEMLRNLCSPSGRINLYIHTEKRDEGWFNLCLRYKSASAFAIVPQWKQWGESKDQHAEPEFVSEKEEAVRTSLVVMQDLLKTAHGSFLTRKSGPDGWEILISIPMKSATESAPKVVDQDWVDSLQILLVEDHFLNQIATRNVIQSWSDNIQIDVAENGEIAVQKFLKNSYDLILMDIQMPVMNGIEAAKIIREHSNVPIIALSAQASDQEAKRCIAAGMNNYLSKPFQPDVLKNVVFKEVSIIR